MLVYYCVMHKGKSKSNCPVMHFPVMSNCSTGNVNWASCHHRSINSAKLSSTLRRCGQWWLEHAIWQMNVLRGRWSSLSCHWIAVRRSGLNSSLKLDHLSGA